MSNKQKPEDPALSVYRKDPDGYEDFVLLAALRCPELWPMFNKTLCLDKRYKFDANDFRSKERYNIFRALRKFRELQLNAGTGSSIGAPSVSIIRHMLGLMMLEDATSLFDGEIDPACEYYTDLLKNPSTPEELEIMVKPSYKEWLLERKLDSAQEDAQFLGIKGTSLIREMHEVSDTLHARLGFDDEDTLKDFGEVIDRDDLVTERMAFPPAFDPMNKALGGGLGRKEHIMIVGPTGAGKTVFACQVAALMACCGKKVCYVTTEQPADELVPRIVSCLSSSSNNPVAFSIIKDGIERDKLSAEEVAEIESIKQRISGNLGIEEWLGSGLTASDLESVVTRFKKRYGELDILILDWIGGALTNGVDPQYKRDYYLEAAQKMKELAYTYNIATISMAQAVADTQKVSHISDKHIAECKTMHREAVAGFGISALADVSADSTTTYNDQQYLYAFKSRKAPGLIISMKRAFNYQKFTMDQVTIKQ